MREVLAGDSRWEQVEYLLDTGFAFDIESRFQTIEELSERLSFVVKPVTEVTTDLIQAAREIGSRIRRKDRRLQLLEYVPAANGLENLIQQHIRSMSDRLAPFIVSLAGVDVNIPLPPGIDPVKEFVAITVGMHTRPHTRMIHLRVGAKGDRCVLLWLLRTKLPAADSPAAPGWEEFAWFNPTRPPDDDQVKGWLNRMIQRAMKEFEAD